MASQSLALTPFLPRNVMFTIFFFLTLKCEFYTLLLIVLNILSST